MMTEGVAEAPPRSRARIAGVFYLITFLTGGAALFVRGKAGMAAGLVAGACYIVVTVLFYFIFKPVSKSLSMLAAIISLVGCANGPLSQFHLLPFQINSLVFFGYYCLLIGYLIFRSTYLPRILGALMAFASLGWLTFIYAPLATTLYPYNMFPGVIGEGALTVWLLAKGVNEERWRGQARAAGY